MKTILLTLSALFTIATVADAQVVYNIPSSGTTPCLFTGFNSKLYYSAADPTHGQELWQCTGVGPGTLVADINPGTASGTAEMYERSMAVLNGKLYFAGGNATTGIELMMYDGVNPPTLVQDIQPGTGSSTPDYMRVINGKLFFSATTSAKGAEMYIYDGLTPPKLYDIYAGSTGSLPAEFTEYNGKIYLQAAHPAYGMELFYYDPVLDTVKLAIDIATGTAHSAPVGLMVYNSLLYFVARLPGGDTWLYEYNGTTNTQRGYVTSSLGNGFDKPGIYHNMMYYPGSTYGNTERQLYRYNPVTHATALVQTIWPGGNAETLRFTVFKDRLFFTARDGIHGKELWMYNDTTATLYADIYPGSTTSDISDLFVYNNLLYFSANSGVPGSSQLYCLRDPVATGIQNVSFNGSCSVMPNPATDNAVIQLRLDQSYKGQVRVADAAGRVIYQSQITTYKAGTYDIPLPLKSQPAGIYYYQFIGEQTTLASGRLVRI